MDLYPTQSAPDITAKLRMLLLALRAALGAWRLEPGQGVVLFQRVSRALGRIERMLVRFRAGRLRLVTRLVTQRTATTVRARGETAERGPALPRKFGWLLAAGKHQAGYFHLQVQDLVNAPEMVALLAASPQAVRILRPLCRALAVDMPGTVTSEPRERKPRKPRKPRPKPEPFKIPLPRGVLTWARREGFGKLR